MNNRIMAALFALTLCLCLFIGVVPVDAEAACNHDNRIKVSATTATCTTDGYAEHYECGACRVWFSNKTTKDVMTDAGKAAIKTPATGHTWVSEHDATHHWEKCSTWGCTATQKKAEHTAGEWSKLDTVHEKLCTGCNIIMEQGNHKQITVDNEDGKTHRDECETCGKVINAKNAHVLKNEDKGEGKHRTYCDYCDYEVMEEHVDLNGNCSCDKVGCDVPMHSFTVMGPVDDTRHGHYCADCGKTQGDNETCTYTYASAEILNGQATHTVKCETCGRGKEGTTKNYCTDGNNDCVCDVCKGPMFHKWDSSFPAVFTAAVAAQCEKEGNVEYGVCNNCHKYFLPNGEIITKEDTVIAPLGHDWNKTMDWTSTHHYYKCSRHATCKTVDRKEEHKLDKYVINANGTHSLYCSGCGYRAVDQAGHSDVAGDDKCECVCGFKVSHFSTDAKIKLVEAVPETCTANGNIAHYLCEECGGTFALGTGKLNIARNVVLEATGHNLVVNETRGNLHDVTCTRKHKVLDSSGSNYVENDCTYKNYVGHEDSTGDCKCDLVNKKNQTCGAELHTHSYKVMPAVEATCSSEGFEAYYYFMPCNRKFADDTYTIEIEAPVSTGLAACAPGEWINEGDNHVKKCTVCGDICDSEAHTDDNGDNRCDVCGFELALEFVAEIPATCTTAGKAAHYVSKVTGRSYWDAEGTKYISDVNALTIKAFAHVDPATGMGPVASDKGNGTHEFKCALCNQVTKTEAHTTGGCFCAACGAGASGEHVATTYVYQAPVCDKDGHEAYAKCSCGKYYNALGEETTYKALTIKALGHTWGAEVFNDDTSGKHFAVCTVCAAKNFGEHKLTASDPLSGNYHQLVCECGKTTLELHYNNNGDNVCDEEGCKRDLSGTKPNVNNHDSVTVVTGNKDNTNSTWSWLKNWLTNTTPSNGGGNAKPQDTAQPGTQAGSSNNVTPPAGNNAPSNGGSQTTDSTGVLQYIISFFNWVFSGFGG